MAVAKLHFPIIGLAVFWGVSIVFLYSSIGLYKFILKPAVFFLHISCYACQLICSCQHLSICCFDNNALSLCQIIKNFNKIDCLRTDIWIRPFLFYLIFRSGLLEYFLFLCLIHKDIFMFSWSLDVLSSHISLGGQVSSHRNRVQHDLS